MVDVPKVCCCSSIIVKNFNEIEEGLELLTEYRPMKFYMGYIHSLDQLIISTYQRGSLLRYNFSNQELVKFYPYNQTDKPLRTWTNSFVYVQKKNLLIVADVMYGDILFFNVADYQLVKRFKLNIEINSLSSFVINIDQFQDIFYVCFNNTLQSYDLSDDSFKFLKEWSLSIHSPERFYIINPTPEETLMIFLDKNSVVKIYSLIERKLMKFKEFSLFCSCHDNSISYFQDICIDNLGRIIAINNYNNDLMVYSHDGIILARLNVDIPFGRQRNNSITCTLSFDSKRSKILFSVGCKIYALNSSVLDIHGWSLFNHNKMPVYIKNLVKLVTMIRSLHLESVISLIPNELLFEIFQFL